MKTYNEILRRRNNIMMNIVSIEDRIENGSDQINTVALKIKLDGLGVNLSLMDWVLEGGRDEN